MVLSHVDTGKEVTFIAAAGGKGIRSKLYSMGPVSEVKLTVLNRYGCPKRFQVGHWSRHDLENHS